MAEAEYRDFVAGGGAAPSSGYVWLVQVIGALTTVALLAGVAVWGYRLAVRDANGVPVIQAMQGPMRIAPEDPGGRVARHMGLSVNTVAGEGSAAAVPDRLVLAPPPIELTDEDTAGIGAGSTAPVPVSIPARADTAASAQTLALAESLVAAASATAPQAVAPEDVAEAVAAAVADAIPTLPKGALQRSLRPRPRPTVVQGADAGLSAAIPVVATIPEEIAPEAVAPGTRLVQIGAFDDADAARREWARVADLHPALFEGKARVIQPATSAGQAFYRLRVHAFETDSDSRRFCAAVESGSLRCIPVPVR